MLQSRFLRNLAILALAAGALAACGRKSDLDTPYQAQIDAIREAERAGEPAPPAPQPPVRDRPFILDSLI